MVNTSEEIMLTLAGRDDASQMFANVDKNAQSMASNISAAMSKVNMGLMNIGQVSDNVMQSLTGKSALDNIFGTTSKAETNAVLLKNMLDDTAKNYDKFYETVDKTTDSSLTSMQELIPALKAFKSATGATDKEMTNITDEMANFGAAVLAQTGSTDLAQQSMMDLSKGIKGAFASLDQYGITQDALQRTGYWNGDEKDVEGFMKAVQKVTGSTEELMETNTGLDALIGKAFSRAGKKIGNEFLPFIKDVKRGFIDLDNELGGGLAASMLVVSGGIDVMNQGFWNISTAANGIRDIGDGFGWLMKKIKGTTDAAEEMSNVLNTVSNVSDMGAGVAGLGGAVGAGAEATKTASKGEKAVEGGMDALLMADMLKGNKTANKEAEKVVKEVSRSEKLYDEIREFNLKANAKRASMMSGVSPEKVLANVKRDTKGLSDALSKSSEFMYDDDLLREWEESGQTFTGAIKGKVTGFKTRLTGAFSSIRNFDLKGTITSPFKSIISSIQGFSFGGALQSGLEKSMGGLGNIASTIKGKFTSFGSSLAGIKDIDIGSKLKSLDTSIYQNIKGFSFKDTLGGLKDSISGLRGTAEVIEEADDIGDALKGASGLAEGMGAAAAAGETAAAAGPAMEAGAVGAEAAAAGATGLSAAFTSMIVPLLALSAVIIIMIPIVAFIAAEAMVFLKLLADFMQALNFDSVDLKGATKGIQQVATALAWVGVAMAAMSFASIMTGLAVITGGFLGLLGPLDIAVNAIKEAAQKLAQFNSTGLDPSVANNIKAVGEALMAVSNAMGALTWNNIVTGFSNFIAGALGFGSVTDGLEQAKNDIMEASNKLNEFSGMTPLDSSVAQNIQNVCNSLASVGEAMSALRSIRDGQNWDSMIGDFMAGIFGEGVDIQTALMNVKDDIIKASQALAEFTGISEIPEDVSSKIQKVGSTLTAVNDTVNSIKEVVGSGFDNWVEGLFGGYDVAGGLEKIKNDLITASQKLAELSGLSAIDEGITEKITQIGTALQKVNEVSTTLTTLGDSGIGEFDSSIISTAVTNIQTAATELAKLNEVQFDGAAADTMLGAIQTTLENVKATLAAASGFTEASMSIGSQIISGVQQGLAPLPGTIQSTVSSAINSAGSAALSGGAMLGRAATEGMKSSLKLADAVNEQVNYALNAMTSRESEFYAAGAALGSAMSKGFESTKGQNVGSPGKMAREIERQMNYGLQFMYDAVSPFYNAGVKLGRQISDGFGNPSLDASMFTAGGSLTAEHIGALKTTISNAPDKTDNRPVTIIVQEGAVNVDARNYTTKEAQGLMITALEGMDTITNVSVNGG